MNAAASARNDLDLLKHRIFMAANVQDYILENLKTPHVQRMGASRFIRHEQGVVKIAEGILKDLDYSDELKSVFSRAEQYTAEILYGEFKDTKIDHVFDRMGIAARELYLFAAIRVYMDGLRRDFPLLKDPAIRLETMSHHGHVDCKGDEIASGEDFAIVLQNHHAKTANLYQLTNTALHEATHHAVRQIASLYLRGKMTLSPDLSRDMDILIERDRANMITTQEIYPLYRRDPDEHLATRCGNGVQARLMTFFNAKDNPDRANRHFAKIAPLLDKDLSGTLAKSERRKMYKLGMEPL